MFKKKTLKEEVDEVLAPDTTDGSKDYFLNLYDELKRWGINSISDLENKIANTK